MIILLDLVAWEGEYEKYKVIQDKNYISDFDKLLNETKEIENK